MSRFVSMAAISLTALGINLATAGRSEAQGPFGVQLQGPFGLQVSVGRGPFSAGINFGYPGFSSGPAACGPTAPFIGGPTAYGPTAPFIGGPAAGCAPTTALQPAPVIVNSGPGYWPSYYRHYHRRAAFYGPHAHGW